MNSSKKKKVLIILLAVALITAIIGGSYAFISYVLSGSKKQIITAGFLSLELIEDDNNLKISDAYPMADEVGMIQNPFTFRLVNKTGHDTNYILKLNDVTVGDSLSYSDVKYGFTKDGSQKIGFLSDLTDNVIDEGVITGSDTIEYSLRLWIREDLEEIATIYNKVLTFKMDAEINQETETSTNTVTELAFNEDFLGAGCATYDDGVDTFLVGQCSQNYVWYSGKLWRVVLKNNETGAVKMVTDNAITAIPYNASGNVAFENSYADQWLNQEFLPTLHDYSDYLVTNSVWDATEKSSEGLARPAGTTTTARTVGLLNQYEYRATFFNTEGYTYLTINNGYYWWLLTPQSESKIWYIGNTLIFSGSPTYGRGIRPAINLKSEIQIDSGTGILSDPYILKGDIQETINGVTLLNTRYSGEYIKFNNELYRIVDVENGLTKITAVDRPSSLESTLFHSTSGVSSFANADIKTTLEEYYQGMDSTWKNMIEQNTTWYLGGVGDGVNYKASVCASVDVNTSVSTCARTTATTTANIALPRAGEMFTSQITRGTNAEFWTLTPFSDSSPRLWVLKNDGALLGVGSTQSSAGARPSMYLKSTTKIASDNTGNGTYEKPYKLSLN